MDSSTTTPEATDSTAEATAAADRLREAAVEDALGRLDLTARVALLAGADMWSLPANAEVVEVRVELPLRAFQTWGADGWSTRPGRYTVEAGRSVADTRATAALELPDGG